MANAGFIGNGAAGRTYAPGYFLAAEECKRVTFDTSLVGEDWIVKNLDGTTYIKQGTPVSEAERDSGFVYEDVDITNGFMPGSLVVEGTIDLRKLKEVYGLSADDSIPTAVGNVLGNNTFTVVMGYRIDRPYVKAVEENH